MIKKGSLFLFALLMISFSKAWAGGVDDFCVLYEKMPEVYFRRISVREIAETILKNYSAMDEKLHVGGRKNDLTFYYKGKAWNFKKPAGDNDVQAWCDLSRRAADKAAELSEKFFNNDFLLSEMVLQKSLPQFDKDSKFFGEDLENQNKRRKHKRFFAVRLEDDECLYLKIGIFDGNSVDNIKKAFEDYPKVSRIKIDLRGNPGGSLEAAVAAADLFLDGGIIVSTKNDRGGQEVFYNADSTELWKKQRVLILVDEKTASAAEMFAHALYDQGRASVKGGETYGKKTLQSLIDLPGGGTAAVTEAYFRRPSEI